MVSTSWKGRIVSGLAVMAVLGMISLPAFAQRGNGGGGGGDKGPKGNTIRVKATLITDCGPFCETDAGGWTLSNGEWFWIGAGTYSLTAGSLAPGIGTTDGFEDATGDGNSNDGVYLPGSLSGSLVQSEILTHNTVFTLNTLDTLGSDGKVNGSTYTVRIHLFTSASNPLPACWANSAPPNNASTQIQAVNWSIFSDNSVAFPDMKLYNANDPSTVYKGFSRMDFNVRNNSCENNIFRFYLRWSTDRGGITIRRIADDKWDISTNRYGEAELEGQGGRRNQTQTYGSWRIPFRIILTQQ